MKFWQSYCKNKKVQFFASHGRQSACRWLKLHPGSACGACGYNRRALPPFGHTGMCVCEQAVQSSSHETEMNASRTQKSQPTDHQSHVLNHQSSQHLVAIINIISLSCKSCSHRRVPRTSTRFTGCWTSGLRGGSRSARVLSVSMAQRRRISLRAVINWQSLSHSLNDNAHCQWSIYLSVSTAIVNTKNNPRRVYHQHRVRCSCSVYAIASL